MTDKTNIKLDDIRIREATTQDLEEILRIDQELYAYDGLFDHTLDHRWSRSSAGLAYFTDRITSPEGLVLIAEHGGKAIGTLIGGVVEALEYRRFPSVCELDSMFVVEGYRSSGIGALLVERFLGWVRANFGGNVRVEVTAANKKALEFYSKVGFVEYNVVLETWVGEPRT